MAIATAGIHTVNVRKSLGLLPQRDEPEQPTFERKHTYHENQRYQPQPASALKPILALTGAALCLSLTSCVAPYGDGYLGSSTTYTAYQPGYRTTSLPRGYRSETISGRSYYYHNGAYYQQNPGGYIVTDAPRQSRYYSEYNRSRQVLQPRGATTVTTYQPGYRLSSLPRGYRSEKIGGSTYYYHNGAYYQRNAGGYVVTQAPRQSRYYSEYTTYR